MINSVPDLLTKPVNSSLNELADGTCSVIYIYIYPKANIVRHHV